MTQIEVKVREALKLALPVLPDAQKAYLLGFLEGITCTFESGQDEISPGPPRWRNPEKGGLQ